MSQVYLPNFPRNTPVHSKAIGPITGYDSVYKFLILNDVPGYDIANGSWFFLNADFISIVPVPDAEYFIAKNLGRFSISKAPKKKQKTPEEPAGKSPEEESETEDKEGTSQQPEENQDGDDDGDDDEEPNEQ